MAIYMQRRILSIRVGTQKTLITEMDAKKRNARVFRCLSFDTPRGVIEDGFILKGDELAGTIKAKLKEEKISTKEVIFTVTSSKIANREVTLPLISEKKLKKLIQNQAAEYFPFDLNNYILTHMVQNQDRKKKTQDLLLFAAPNNLIQSYYDLAKKINATVLFIDYDGNSAFQIMRKQIRENCTSMAIQINTNNCMINIMYGDKLMLQRSIPYGLAPILETVMEFEVFNAKTQRAALELLEEQHVIHTHLNNDAVKNLKVNEAMLAISDSYRRNLEYETARVDVTDAFSSMINNFVRVIDYYHSKHSERAIKEIILTGTGSNISGILKLFANETGIEVRRLDDLIGVNIERSVIKKGYDPIEFLSCIGATLEPIGFASLEVVKREKSKIDAMNYAVITALVFVLGVVAVGIAYFQYNAAKEENEIIESQIRVIQSIEDVFAEHEEAKAKFDVMDEIHRLSDSPNDQLNELFDEISTKIPSNMIIDSFSVSGDVVTMNITAGGSLPTITKLLLQFDTIDRIKDVVISPISISEEDKAGGKTHKFTINFNYKTLEEREEEEALEAKMKASSDVETKEENEP